MTDSGTIQFQLKVCVWFRGRYIDMVRKISTTASSSATSWKLDRLSLLSRPSRRRE